ncbi:Hypothetical predicted protein, partial [Paramuricea clavata]
IYFNIHCPHWSNLIRFKFLYVRHLYKIRILPLKEQNEQLRSKRRVDKREIERKLLDTETVFQIYGNSVVVFFLMMRRTNQRPGTFKVEGTKSFQHRRMQRSNQLSYKDQLLSCNLVCHFGYRALFLSSFLLSPRVDNANRSYTTLCCNQIIDRRLLEARRTFILENEHGFGSTAFDVIPIYQISGPARSFFKVCITCLRNVMKLLSSFDEQALPASWKYANVTPLPKTKPVTIIAKHIRPISLTPTLSKLAEDFIVRNYVGPAILEIIDPNQFGAVPKSSTTQALISMIHTWASATDGTGALLDYRKAFDLIDHRIPVDKILSLRMPRGVARWVCDSLLNRFQRVKLSNDCFSEWGAVSSGVPQGTKLGPSLFLLMINDLNPPDAHSWKHVDDTTLAEVVPRNDQTNIQNAVTEVEKWSNINNLQLNAYKCKEMVIDFKKVKLMFDTITVNCKELELVSSAKVLGVTISNSLQWVDHTNNVIKKANKRYLCDDLERIQKHHKLYHLLPPSKTSAYNLRRLRRFDCPATRTNRF